MRGKRYFLNYGVASKENGQLVDGETLFAIGSISKTFRAALASYTQVRGMLSLKKSAGPELKNYKTLIHSELR